MSLFKRENKINILKKTQENLEKSQKNVEAVLKHLENKDGINVEDFTEEEKRRAAYALNYCMVSVSQIVDYDDKYVLEQEYESILNNLNLEVMPKDEALLNLFRQLLDTITFFRIQEGDKKFLEREYQRRLNDAIWNAAPNFGVIIAGGDPTTIAISLATQLGIGYMNYRREKSDIMLEHEQKKWKLESSAMEQFNGLKRELFTTAWRLANKYNFKDEYRITERQISQFNNILLDVDPTRRYERLSYIQDCFKAYPPFWYYLGNAANQVYQICKAEEWKTKAKDAYEKFKGLTDKNILREDQLIASCALECFELEEDQEKRKTFLSKACDVAGNTAYDILQICAISYIKNNNLNDAIKLLKWLFNEGYNTDFNCKLLSHIYVRKYIEGDKTVKKEYEELADRIENKNILYPLPVEDKETAEELNKKYFVERKKWLQKRFGDCIAGYVQQCEYEYEQCRESVEDFLEFTSKMITVVAKTTSETFSTEFFRHKIKEKIQGKRSKFSGYSTDVDISFETIYKDGLTIWAERLNKDIENTNNGQKLEEMEEKYYSFSKNIKVDAGLQTKMKGVNLDKLLFDTCGDVIDKNREKRLESIKGIWEVVEKHKEKIEECEKFKIYNGYDKMAGDLIKRITPKDEGKSVFNNNETLFNIAAVLTIKGKGVHRRVLHLTTTGILVATGKKVEGYAEYGKIGFVENKLKIGECGVEYKYDDFGAMEEMIKEIKQKTNQHIAYTKLAEEIKGKVTKQN